MDISPEKKALLLQGIQSVIREQTERGNPYFIIDMLLAPKDDQQRIMADIANAIAQQKFVEIQHMRAVAQALTPQPPPPPPPAQVQEVVALPRAESADPPSEAAA